MSNNLISKDARKLSRRLHAMNVSDEGFCPDENLCIFLPTIHSRNIRLDGVRSYRFITSSYADRRIGRLKAFAKDGIERHPCIYWVVTSKVFLMMSVGTQAKRGRRAS
jgi:hypothetical protein